MISRYQKRISIPLLSGPDDGLFPEGRNRLVSTSTARCHARTCTPCLDKLTSDRLGGMILGLDPRIPNGTPLKNQVYDVRTAHERLGLGPDPSWARMAF